MVVEKKPKNNDIRGFSLFVMYLLFCSPEMNMLSIHCVNIMFLCPSCPLLYAMSAGESDAILRLV